MNAENEWRSNLDEEVRFWRSLFDRSCPNQDFVGRFHERVACDRPFPAYLAALVSQASGDVVRVLDVGAGPMTQIGTLHKTKRIEVTAIDPLAEEYARLFEEFNIVPRIRTRPGSAERLTDLFSEDSFDLVYCRNALDHSHDALLGIRQMIEVCKPDSYCWLNHAANEGRNQGYRGLHQWDFRPEGSSDLAIYGKIQDRTVFLAEELGDSATVHAERGQKWCTARIRKQTGPKSG